MAGLSEEIKALPMGLDTYISEGGRNLSGGVSSKERSKNSCRRTGCSGGSQSDNSPDRVPVGTRPEGNDTRCGREH